MKLWFFKCVALLGILPNLSFADIEPPRKDVVPLYILETIDGAGQVQIQKADTQGWANAKEGAALEEGDSLKVGPKPARFSPSRTTPLSR